MAVSRRTMLTALPALAGLSPLPATPLSAAAQAAGDPLGVRKDFPVADTVLSLNAAWRPRDGMLVAAGVDNLFDRVYAEHLSRAGAMVQGYVQTRRVNEPGRTLWLKASANLP